MTTADETTGGASTISATVDGVKGDSLLTSVVPIQITTDFLPDATVGVPYSFTLSAIHGLAPYTWSTFGPVGDGFVLDPTTGTITTHRVPRWPARECGHRGDRRRYGRLRPGHLAPDRRPVGARGLPGPGQALAMSLPGIGAASAVRHSGAPKALAKYCVSWTTWPFANSMMLTE